MLWLAPCLARGKVNGSYFVYVKSLQVCMEGLGEGNYGRLEGQDSFAGCPVLSCPLVMCRVLLSSGFLFLWLVLSEPMSFL